MKTATSGFISAISDGCPYHTVKFYYNGTELDITPKTFNAYCGDVAYPVYGLVKGKHCVVGFKLDLIEK